MAVVLTKNATYTPVQSVVQSRFIFNQALRSSGRPPSSLQPLPSVSRHVMNNDQYFALCT